jgi:hypothetical protein
MTDKFSLHVPAFIIALGMGLLYVYLATPHRKVIIRHPTPENVGKVTYEDAHGNCFILKKESVSCARTHTRTP